MDIGATLRTARERCELPISELAARTKIPVGVLLAIEDNAFEKVPRGIFARGFIRAYAREVDLDPEDLVQQFLMETEPPATDTPEAEAADADIEETRIDPDASGSGPGWGYALIVAALLVAFVSFNRPAPSRTPEAMPLAAVEEPLAGNGIQPASAVIQDLQPVATVGEGLRFELQVQGPCWVEAIVDGRQLVYRLMQPGERQTIDAERELVLRVGDPGAISYSVNGRSGEPLGRAGMPITVRFTSQGERTELAS